MKGKLAKDLLYAYWKWRADDGNLMAAAVSYYMAVSFFPLLLVLMSIGSLLLRFTHWGQDARQRLFDLIADQAAPELAKQVEAVFSNVESSATYGGPIGLAVLFFTSLAIFVHFDDAMDRIWSIQPVRQSGVLKKIQRVLIKRLRAFLMFLGLGLFIMAGFVASMSLSVMIKYASGWLPMHASIWKLITLAAAVLLNWLLFTLVYKAVTKVSVKWTAAARGALFASVMWEVGRRLLAALVVGSRFSVYGVGGAFLAILLWMFYATTILFLGAEYIQIFSARHQGRASLKQPEVNEPAKQGG